MVLVGDHTKTPKDGRKIPAVTTLHQESETGSKPAFFRGHHWGCIALLVRAADKVFATPLWANTARNFTSCSSLTPKPARTALAKVIKSNLCGLAKDWITQLIRHRQEHPQNQGLDNQAAS